MGEVGNAHDGSLNTAHAYINVIAKSGAHAVKFQTHIAAAESSPGEPFRVQFSYADATRYDYWKRLEFTATQWKGLKDHAEQAGLVFLSSPFSPEAVDLLQGLGIAAWKVASGEINNLPMLERMARTKKPLLISTGMGYMDEIDQAVEICRTQAAPYLIFHCTTAYPVPPEKAGLNVIGELIQRYGCPVGYSDHSGDIVAGLAAAVLGISALEVHVTFSRECFGPDVPASLTPPELAQLAQGLKVVRTMTDNPVRKDELTRQLEPMRKLFCKSIVYARDLAAGTTLRAEHLGGRKPGDGVPVAQIPRLVGRRLKSAVAQGQPLSMDHLT